MRRLTEGPDQAPGQTSAGGAPNGIPTPGSGVVRGRVVLPYFVFAMTCYLVAPYLGLSSREVDPRIAEVWPTGGVGFVLLTVVWHAGRRILTGTLTAMVLVFAGTALLLGYSATHSVWWALTGVLQSVLMVWWYRRALGDAGWIPRHPRDLASLLHAAVGSSVVLGVLGGFPALGPDEVFSRLLLWWVLRNTVFCFIGAATFLLIFYARREDDPLPPSPVWNRVGLLLASALCVYGTYYDPSLPLSWLLIVPSVWGGLTLTLRGTAYLSLTVSLMAMLMTYLPHNQFGYTRWLPAASIVDLLVIASTVFMLLLTLFRVQRARLVAELAEQSAHSEDQRQMLEAVFETMTDGVMVFTLGNVPKYNGAARRLLGRSIPQAKPGSWVNYFGVSAADGTPIHDRDVRRLLVEAERTGVSPTLELVVRPPDGKPRYLDLTVHPFTASSDRSAMMLLHDVTTKRARLRELTNFAGTVAHDLRGPLTVLDGWLELAEDSNEEGDREQVDEALSRARDGSRRMRQVIEDWLGYTVVQNGQLHPERVELEPLVSEIISTHRSGWDDADEAEFALALEHAVAADPALLRQVLDNLVGNAIKYTPPGTTPSVRITSAVDDEPGWIRLEVTDNGMGIPEGEEERIFEEFHRGPRAGRSAGTGLGLSLSRRIVARHGGQLTARSNPEGGSTFTFILPAA